MVMVNDEQKTCPICNEVLPQSARGKTFHSEKHGIKSHELAKAIEGNIRTCRCGCGNPTRWIGWKEGYENYIRGHMTKDVRALAAKKLSESLKENHWSRGKNKNTSDVLKESGRKTSLTLREGFSSGRISHWSHQENKKEIVKKIVKSRKESYKNKEHWKFMETKDVLKKLFLILNNKFLISTTEVESIVENRKNNREKIIDLRCTNCNMNFKKSIYDIIRNDTYDCYICREQYASIPQLEVQGYVDTLISKKVLSSDRSNKTGFELDIFIPDLNLAIEFNGLYWHSEKNVSKNYHSNKTKACADLGIKLFHVYHDEWTNKRKIVESMIQSRINCSKRIGARKCAIRIVDPKSSKEFFNETHIDGDARGFITYGLFNKDFLVSCVKLRKPLSIKHKGKLEIARFSSSLGMNVAGGFSKLLKHIKKLHNETILTYVDTRFGSNGEHCISAGMKLIGKTGPRMWWTDKENRFDRLYCRATKSLSERENAKRLKLIKIWGCDNLLFEI